VILELYCQFLDAAQGSNVEGSVLVVHWFRAVHWRLDGRIWFLIVSTFVSTIVFLTTSWLTPGAFSLLVLSFLYACWRHGHLHHGPIASPWVVTGLLFATYCAASALWSADPVSSLKSGLIIAGIVLGVRKLIDAVASCPLAWLTHGTRALLVAFVIGVLYLLIEEVSGHQIKRLLYWPFHTVKPGSSTVAAVTRYDLDLAREITNWNMPPLVFALWPVLLITSLQLAPRARPVQWLIAAVATLTVFLSAHSTSKVAVAAGLAAFAAASFNHRPVRYVLAGYWILAFLAVVPLANAAYSHKLYRDARLKPSVQARIIIWGFTAELVPLQPWLGVGAAASKRLDRLRLPAAEAERPGDHVYTARRTGPHAHNIYLQSWYELGAVGVGLLLAFGLTVLSEANAAARELQPYLLASAGTVVVTTSMSFGLFEPWFLAAIGMAAAMLVLAQTYWKRLGTEPKP
jgi:O-Antigen ligase